MTLAELLVKITMDSSEYDKGIADSQSKLSSFGSGLKRGAGTIAKLAGGALAGATTAVVGFAGASVKTGMQFDTAMSQVAATMGKTMEEMKNETGSVELAWGTFTGNLRDYAKEMGANTQFSATQAAEALNYMALAGYDTQTSMNMLPNVMSLASAGAMDLATASDMVTDTQTAFGISLDRTSQMVDEMAKAASTGNTSVQQLGDAFLTVGGLAKELNGGMITLSDGSKAQADGVQELEIALTAMANAGVKGSEAGTHMRNMLTKLSSPTSEGTKAMEAMGVSVFDTEGKMRSLKDIFGDLDTAMGSMTQEQKIQTISELFNARDLSSAEALLGAVSQDWDKIGESILNAEGAAQKMQETQLDNLAGDITNFKSALEGVKIAISDNLSSPFRGFVQSASGGLREVTKLIEGGDFEGAVEKAGEVLAGLAMSAIEGIPKAVEAGALLLTGLVEGVVTQAPAVFESLSATLSEGFMTAISTMMSGASVTDQIIPVISGIFTGIINTANTFLPMLTTLAITMMNNLASGLAQGIPNLLSNVLPMLVQLSETIRANASNLVDAGINLVLQLAQGFINSFPVIIQTVPTIVENIANIINDNAPKLLVAGVKIIGYLVMGLIKAIPTIIANIPKIAEAIFAVWSAVNWVSLGTKTINFIKQGFTILKNELPNALKSIGEKTVDFFRYISWQNAGQGAIRLIATGIKAVGRLAWMALKSIGKAGINVVKSINWASVGRSIVTGIAKGIVAVPGIIANALLRVVKFGYEKVKNFLGIRSPSKLFRDEIGVNVGKAIPLGIEDTLPTISRAMDEVADRLSVPSIEPFSISARNSYIPDTADGVLGAMESLQVQDIGSEESYRNITVVLELNRTELARTVFNLYNSENQRHGVELAGGYA